MRTITFKIEENLLEMLDWYAIRNKMYRSEVIREAIEKLLKEELEKETVHAVKIEKGGRLW
jgi:metal-responsive CopG/Arc/MetJ family transcriptional regulator